MGIPDVNPISAGWIPRGGTFDYIGASKIYCPACNGEHVAQRYRIQIGGGGFGAPYFISPFLKRRSTVGKVGGKRGLFSICTGCESLWPEDDGAKAVLVAGGHPATGAVSSHVLFNYENRKAAASEASASQAPQGVPKVRKMRDL